MVSGENNRNEGIQNETMETVDESSDRVCSAVHVMRFYSNGR